MRDFAFDTVVWVGCMVALVVTGWATVTYLESKQRACHAPIIYLDKFPDRG